jgi:serine/threonine protein kinase
MPTVGNILISDSYIAKVTDFGSIKSILTECYKNQHEPPRINGPKVTDAEYSERSLDMTSGVGTPLYMSLEVRLGTSGLVPQA